MNENGIVRFLEAQKDTYKIAKKELINRRKESHWMWFIFPQLAGLGKSFYSTYFGLKSKKEVEEYWKNRKLRKRLIKLLNIILNYEEGITMREVFGELDALKFHSCVTLFYIVTWENIFKKVLDKYYNSCIDRKTVILLNKR